MSKPYDSSFHKDAGYSTQNNPDGGGDLIHSLAQMAYVMNARSGRPVTLNNLINQLHIAQSRDWQLQVELDQNFARVYRDQFLNAFPVRSRIQDNIDEFPNLSKKIYRISGETAMAIISDFATHRYLSYTASKWEDLINDDLLEKQQQAERERANNNLLPLPTKSANGGVTKPIHVDVNNLSLLGESNITEVGTESIFVLKDGLHYYSKVGITENYQVGPWNFAEYPNGKAPTASSTDLNKYDSLYETEIVDIADRLEVTRANLAGEPREVKLHIVIRDLLDDMTDIMNGNSDVPIGQEAQAQKAIALLDEAIENKSNLHSTLSRTVDLVREWLKVDDLESADLWYEILPMAEVMLAELDREAWELTAAEFVEQELKKDEYYEEYLKEPQIAVGIKEILSDDWKNKLHERALIGRISDRSLDDYVVRYGIDALRDFRGQHEKGVIGYEVAGAGGEEKATQIEAIAKRYAMLSCIDGKPSDIHYRFASHFVNVNPEQLEYIANGCNERALQLFSELAEIEVPKSQSEALSAIRAWAGNTRSLDANSQSEEDEKIHYVVPVRPEPELWFENDFFLSATGQGNWLPDFDLFRGIDYSNLFPFIRTLEAKGFPHDANILRSYGMGDAQSYEEAKRLRQAYHEASNSVYSDEMETDFHKLSEKLLYSEASLSSDLLGWMLERFSYPESVATSLEELNAGISTVALIREDENLQVLFKCADGLKRITGDTQEEIIYSIKSASLDKYLLSSRLGINVEQLEALQMLAGSGQRYKVGSSLVILKDSILIEDLLAKNYSLISSDGIINNLTTEQSDKVKSFSSMLNWNDQAFWITRFDASKIAMSVVDGNHSEQKAKPTITVEHL